MRELDIKKPSNMIKPKLEAVNQYRALEKVERMIQEIAEMNINKVITNKATDLWWYI